MTEEENIALLRKLSKRMPTLIKPIVLEKLIQEGKTADEIWGWIHGKIEFHNQMMKDIREGNI